MVIQDGLTQLKILDKRMQGVLKDVEKYAARNNQKTNHPMGKVGTDEYSKKEAEKNIKSLRQSFMDLLERHKEIKLAIHKTNAQTTIEVAGREMTIEEAIYYKEQGLTAHKNFISTYNAAVNRAKRDVTDWNMRLPHDADEKLKADVWYLLSPEDIQDNRDFVESFYEEVDGALNKANATTELIGLDD